MTEPQKGDRVRLIYTSDEFTKLRSGATGTVTRYQKDIMDEYDQLHVAWDEGSRLGLIPQSGDQWEIIE